MSDISIAIVAPYLMLCKIHERSRQLLRIRFRLHDGFHHYWLLTRDDLCRFGSWPSKLSEVFTRLVSQTRLNLVDVVAVASKLVLLNIDVR